MKKVRHAIVPDFYKKGEDKYLLVFSAHNWRGSPIMKRAYAFCPIQNILYKDITIMIQFFFIYTLKEIFFKIF